MTSKGLNKENSFVTIAWLDALRNSIPQWSSAEDPHIHLYSPRFFKVETLRQRELSVVPFHHFWIPSEDRVLPVLKARGCTKLYATGFDINSETYFSSPMEGEPLDEMQAEYFSYCLTVSPNESCLILNTYMDYWMMAAPFTVLREIVGQPLDGALNEFIANVREHELFEAGQDFAQSIVDAYRVHNEEMQKLFKG